MVHEKSSGGCWVLIVDMLLRIAEDQLDHMLTGSSDWGEYTEVLKQAVVQYHRKDLRAAEKDCLYNFWCAHKIKSGSIACPSVRHAP